MDAKRIHSDHIIERYLADQLDAGDTAAFEAYYLQNPDAVRAIERTLRLKEGLAVLRERGELNSLVHAHSGWTLRLGLAAGVAVALVGAWLWMSHSVATPLAATLTELRNAGGHPVPIANTLVLARTRGAEPAIQVSLPPTRSAIELRILPSSRALNQRYRVTVSLIDSATVASPVGNVRGLTTSAEGFVVAFLDTQGLKPGRYAVELLPERSDSPGFPSDRFVVNLR